MIILKSRGHMIFRFSIGIRLQPYITQYDFLEFGLSLGTILKLGFLIKYGTFWQYLTIILKSEFVQFEGLLAFYISKLIPMLRKLLATHLIIILVCQGPPRPLKRGLRAPGGPLKCKFVKFEGLLACYSIRRKKTYYHEIQSDTKNAINRSFFIGSG